MVISLVILKYSYNDKIKQLFYLLTFFLFLGVLSKFDFVFPSYLINNKEKKVIKPVIDSDGDHDVIRRNEVNTKEGIIFIGILNF